MDQKAYELEVLYGGALPVYQNVPVNVPVESSERGAARGVITTGMGLAIAAFALLGRRKLPQFQDFSAAMTRIVRPVRLLHSGHLGDYVAWLTLGVALLAVLFSIFIH